jgi:hypothetical protein
MENGGMENGERDWNVLTTTPRLTACLAGFLRWAALSRRRRLDDIAKRPSSAGLGSPTRDRKRIKLQSGMRSDDDPAIAGASNRRTEDRLAEAGVIPADGDLAVGIVHIDAYLPAAISDDQLRLPVRHGPETEPTRCDRNSRCDGRHEALI